MTRLLCGYVVGASAAHGLPDIPSNVTLTALALCAFGLVMLRPAASFVVGAALGCLIVGATAHDAIGHRIAACIDGSVVEVYGRVVGLPKTSERQIQFDVEPRAIEPWPSCAGSMPRRLRLSWFEGPAVAPGEIWQLRLKLRSVRGYQNPGGFDYEAWSLANGIDGGGSVRYGERGARAEGWSWDRLRLELRERFAALQIEHDGILLALLSGDGGLMTDADWALFRATGTVHLMVISGLHLTIIATIGVGVGRALARLSSTLLARSGCVWPGSVCGGVFVTLYSCLAGWGIPVLRSWLATIVVLLLLPMGRRLSLPVVFLWVAAIVLTSDPLAPLQAGFWLSFGAVAILLAYFAPRFEAASALRTLLMAQIVLGVAMVPALVGSIGSVAWIGPVANLVAVPLVSVVVVPLDLLVGAFVTLSKDGNVWLVDVADAIVGFVVTFLQALARFDWNGWRAERGAAALLLSGAACCLMMLPLALRHRLLLLPCVVLPVMPVDARANQGEFGVTVLDVGQGLSVVVETARHRLLYDAGPRFPSGFDLGNAVVLPALRRRSDAPLDAAILSHGDMDHVGGFGAVAQFVPVRALIGGEPVAGYEELRPCRAAQGWQWDGVRFQVLHPLREAGVDNDRSCVLRVSNDHASALLPGDVTRVGEAEFASSLSGPVDLLVAAHHGSRSSSSDVFVRVARPRIVVYSAGYMNRFGHPHADVWCRFDTTGAANLLTARSGALLWRSEQAGEVVQWRYHAPPYWRVGIAQQMWGSRCAFRRIG
jgi:competence protein ComEC